MWQASPDSGHRGTDRVRRRNPDPTVDRQAPPDLSRVLDPRARGCAEVVHKGPVGPGQEPAAT
ncbi:hypothetical protein GCM10009817_14130 [Terrabacter lapilli]|uniref:Uncharacterized protein n=1 Tax=Terrabacter lapilli TaxID=436231 RepID=A0ABN2RUC0_9MICO